MKLRQVRDIPKEDLDLVPIEILQQIIDVLKNGAEKYGRHSWEHGLHFNYEGNRESIHGHTASARKEDRDVESGLLHYSHAGTRALMAGTLKMRGV